MKSNEIILDKEEQKEFNRQVETLSFGVVEITPKDEFDKMLKNSIKNNIPLRVKCGIDPTNPDVHLGHSVPYTKMRQFQDFGHIGIVIIGDYTASIGDPTGKNEARPSLSNDLIKQNSQDYFEQIKKIIDIDRTEVSYQSEWFAQVDMKQVIKWAAETTVAKLLSHETFGNRLKDGLPLSLHELFYPVLQGLDSVFIKADVELGGTDQKFNVLMGRDYQKNRNLRPQVAMLLPLLTGTCGSVKMSKSLGNYIGINDQPFDKFGKIMSIPDILMSEYYKLLGRLTFEEHKSLFEKFDLGQIHPNELKKDLAELIVGFYHGKDSGIEMRQQFESVFKKGGVPEDSPTFELVEDKSILDLLNDLDLIPSKKEGRRLIEQKAIGFVDGDKITEAAFVLTTQLKGQTLKIGKKKFLKLI